MRILVCGGRNFNDYELMHKILGRMFNGEYDTLIHGDAPGADRLSETWLKHNFKMFQPIQRYPADWKKHGYGAGPIRNQQMLDEGKPDIVIAFPGGTGTKDMIDKAKKAGKIVIEISAPTKPVPVYTLPMGV